MRRLVVLRILIFHWNNKKFMQQHNEDLERVANPFYMLIHQSSFRNTSAYDFACLDHVLQFSRLVPRRERQNVVDIYGSTEGFTGLSYTRNTDVGNGVQSFCFGVIETQSVIRLLMQFSRLTLFPTAVLQQQPVLSYGCIALLAMVEIRGILNG
jgi:hypothetical protein